MVQNEQQCQGRYGDLLRCICSYAKPENVIVILVLLTFTLNYPHPLLHHYRLEIPELVTLN